MNFQGKLVTKLQELSVGDAVIEFTNSIDPEKLNSIIKTLLEQKGVEPKLYRDGKFDYIVGGKLLLLPIEKHLELYSGEVNVDDILSENLVEIEYGLSIEPPEPKTTLPHDDWVSCVDANDLYLLTGSYDKSIRIYSIENLDLLTTIPSAHEKPLTSLKFINQLCDADNLYFVSAGHDEVAIIRKFNLSSKKHNIQSTFSGHNRSINCLDVLDNMLATGGFDKSLRLWTCEAVCPEKPKKTKTKAVEASGFKRADLILTGHTESITGVNWCQNVRNFNSIATSSLDNTICIWDVEVGESKQKLLSSKPLLDLDYNSSNNLFIAGSCDRHVRAWDSRVSENSSATMLFTSHSGWVSKVAFGNNVNNFISAGYDNLVKLWDVRSPKACLYDLIGHHSKVLDITWNNARHVFSGAADSSVRVFNTK